MRVGVRMFRAGARKVGLWKSFSISFSLAIAATCVPAAANASGSAVVTNGFADYEKRIRSAEMVGALKADLFGDGVSLYNGATEFSAIDVEVPGNNSLPVRLGRRFKVDVKTNSTLTSGGFSGDILPLGGFGAWDIDVPYLYGMFDGSYGWRVGQGDVKRCSGAVIPRVTSPFEVNEVWSGYHMRIPGEGDRELTLLGVANQKPSDGNTYRWGTRDLHRGRCLSSTLNYPGEGFVILDAQGISYTFNHAITRDGGVVEKQGVTLQRQQVFLMATRVQDRHGNYVDYQYTGDRLTKIASSDGRVIEVHWSGNAIDRVVAHGREWRYSYGSTMTVELPDHSKWQYEPIGALHVTPAPPLDDGGACSESLPATASPFSMVITHPSGAKGRFDFAYTRHGRSGTPASACTVDSTDPETGTVYRSLKLPDYFYTYSLLSKTITGPGISEMKWEYSWEDPTTGRVDLDPMAPYCGFCDPDKSAFVKEPSGVTKQYVFGALWYHNEGRLLGTYTRDAAGTLVKSEVLEYVSEQEIQNGVPFPKQHGELTASDDISGLFNRPIKRTTITQDGVSFVNRVDRFDEFARPVEVAKFNGSHSRTDTTSYYHHLSKWVIGQVASVVNKDTGKTVSQTDYEPASALPLRTYSFGKLQQTLGHYADGTLATIKDGRNFTTTLSGWKRGIPQLIQYPSTPEAPGGATESAVVSDDGTIASVTDEIKTKTCYTYDAVGRLASIIRTSETQTETCKTPDFAGDPSAWNPTLLTFVPVAAAEYGIAATHWKQTVSTGNSRKITYFDAMWRPVVEENYDAADAGNTRSLVVRRYDTDGQQIFQSYPRGTLSTYADTGITGVHTTYDALGRVRYSNQDSEQGVLSTETRYLPGFLRQVVNPRGVVTTQSFQAFDVPTYEFPLVVSGPAGVLTTISRDVFGKPKEMTRTGPDG